MGKIEKVITDFWKWYDTRKEPLRFILFLIFLVFPLVFGLEILSFNSVIGSILIILQIPITVSRVRYLNKRTF